MATNCGQVADPGADLVVADGVHVHRAAADLVDPRAPFAGERGLFGEGGEEPHGGFEEAGFGEGGSAGLLAGHGVAGEELRLVGAVVEGGGEVGDGGLGAADVGEELVGLEDGGEALHPVEDGQDGDGEEDDVGGFEGLHAGGGVVDDLIDGSELVGGVALFGVGVDAGDGAGELDGAQGEADRGADQARSDDDDTFHLHEPHSTCSQAQAA